MGLKPLEFYSISPKEFSLMVEGFRRRRLDEYRLNRNIMYVMVKLWSSKPVNDPNDLWELDERTETKDDELAKLFESIKNG
jgi:hypothetical protein